MNRWFKSRWFKSANLVYFSVESIAVVPKFSIIGSLVALLFVKGSCAVLTVGLMLRLILLTDDVLLCILRWNLTIIISDCIIIITKGNKHSLIIFKVTFCGLSERKVVFRVCIPTWKKRAYGVFWKSFYMMFYEDDIHPEIQVPRPFQESATNISSNKKSWVPGVMAIDNRCCDIYQ